MLQKPHSVSPFPYMLKYTTDASEADTEQPHGAEVSITRYLRVVPAAVATV